MPRGTTPGFTSRDCSRVSGTWPQDYFGNVVAPARTPALRFSRLGLCCGFLDLFCLRHLRLDDDPSHAEALRLDDFDRQIPKHHAVSRRDLAPQPRRNVPPDGFFSRLTDIDLETIGQIFDRLRTICP